MASAAIKYDDASWHSDGDFPENLPPAAGATHIGMYIAWATLRHLSSPALDTARAQLLQRVYTPGEFALEKCAGVLSSEDLNEDGNRFTAVYYDINKCLYFSDLDNAFRGLESLYHLDDSWESFDRISKLIDKRLIDFRAGKI